MTRRLTAILALLAALQGGCERDRVRRPSRERRCRGRRRRLRGEFPQQLREDRGDAWLRPDGRLRQRFGRRLGRKSRKCPPRPTVWVWSGRHRRAVGLAAPARAASHGWTEHLELRVASPTEHILARYHDEPNFRDRITLDGESAVTATGATFKECLTGLELPVVVDAGAYRQLRHYHRTMNARGKIALTIVEGHLVPAGSTTSERLVVDAFISIKPGTGC
jgi:hypothetical protein